MSEITFLPDNIKTHFPQGASLLDAARSIGIFVETPCGGEGSCKKCLVKITQNNETREALICRTAVPDESITVELKQLTDSGKTQDSYLKDIAFIPDGLSCENSEAFIKKIKLKVAPAAPLDGLSDADRFTRAFKREAECAFIELPLSVLSCLPERLREAEGEIIFIYFTDNNIAKVINIFSAGNEQKIYCAAVDIGTTTVSLLLTDLEDKKVLVTRNAYNSQVECALDIIGRINYAKKNLNELRARILKTVNELISDACGEIKIEPSEILFVSLAGNTVMTHIFLGIIPEYIRLSPYTPAVFQPQIYTAQQTGLKVCENAPLLFAPCVGSYVGGDITAGLLCTELASEPKDDDSSPGELILFIDIGTNGEIVLGSRDFIFACACSAGPAFEGGGIKHGMRACPGAIEKVIIKNGKPQIFTIGNAPPIGICGSGVISVAAELFKNGIIDSAGKFSQKTFEYILCEGSPGKQKITISEADIDNFIRAKGAVFSACQTLLESVEMSFSNLDKIYVAGGFGRFLNLEDARTIGLLPRIADEKYTFLGNSSALGAYLTLISEEYRNKQLKLAKRITYVDLSSEPRYMDYYTGALFLPHTDKKLFE
ncbi:MAG: ASKHA domain-containing protein [Treponema sp.]|nr:ASKHA domain-containing protein [Treponema sp.]